MEPFACNAWVQEWSKNFGTHASKVALPIFTMPLPVPYLRNHYRNQGGVMSSHTKLLKSESQLQWLLSSLVYHLNPSGTNSKVEMMKKIQMYPTWSKLFICSLLHSLEARKLDALAAPEMKVTETIAVRYPLQAISFQSHFFGFISTAFHSSTPPSRVRAHDGCDPTGSQCVVVRSGAVATPNGLPGSRGRFPTLGLTSGGFQWYFPNTKLVIPICGNRFKTEPLKPVDRNGSGETIPKTCSNKAVHKRTQQVSTLSVKPKGMLPSCWPSPEYFDTSWVDSVTVRDCTSRRIPIGGWWSS